MKNTATLWILGGTTSESKAIKQLLGRQFSTRILDDSRDFDALFDDNGQVDSDQTPDLVIIAANATRQKLIFRLTSSCVAPVPVMVLAGKANTSQLLDYLCRGAIDVFVRPLSLELVAAKATHFLREKRDQALRRNLGLTLDRFTLEVRTADLATHLTHKEFQIITLLYQAYPHGMPRLDVACGVWQGMRVVKKSFDVHLFNLRQKLELIGFEIQFVDRASYRLASAPRHRPRPPATEKNHSIIST